MRSVAPTEPTILDQVVCLSSGHDFRVVEKTQGAAASHTAEECARCGLLRLERRGGFAQWGGASDRATLDGEAGMTITELRHRFCWQHGHLLSPDGEGRSGGYAHYFCHTCAGVRCMRVMPGVQPASAEEADLRLVGEQPDCRACRAWKKKAARNSALPDGDQPQLWT